MRKLPFADPLVERQASGAGINVLSTLVVEIEAENDVVGFAVTTGGTPPPS